jgi:hypothetical protein
MVGLRRVEDCRTDMVLEESSHVPVARAHHHRRQHRKSWCNGVTWSL